MSDVAVIGTGYVGLTTGAYLAHLGHHVVCADVVPEKVEMLSRGEIPIFEAGLEELVREGLDGGRLRFVLGAANAVPGAEFVFLCVPTPQGDDGRADMSYIEAAAREIGPMLEPEAVVINKSTVPVGSTRAVERSLGRDDVFVVSNPEFLREGSAVHDSLHPDRIVIGADDQSAAIRVASLFEDIQAPLIVTDPASAETIKYASNAFLATKVSFINAIANLCEAVGADVREVVLGMGYDKRIGFEFLRPGPGWGGSCFHPSETVLARRGQGIPQLLTFAELFARVEHEGASGWSVLSWREGAWGPEYLPVAAFTKRPFEGELVEVTTKMGRRLLVTPDHPLLVGDGVEGKVKAVKQASGLSLADWLPLSIGLPDVLDPPWRVGSILDGLAPARITPEQVIVRLGGEQLDLLSERAWSLPSSRRRDVLRSRAMRLTELRRLGIPEREGWYGTATNGTYVPNTIDIDGEFWRMVGLYLAEGHVTVDGSRHRVCWTFHPHAEDDLVGFVASYWRDLGVHVSIHRRPTATAVVISSRILAAWFRHVLGAGVDAYTKSIAPQVWIGTEGDKRQLLRGLWDGDGSWSLVNRGPSVVLEYGTVSAKLADAMLRLLGELGITARLRIGRTSKSTTNAYWLVISGATQISHCLWLFGPEEAARIKQQIGLQATRIRPTGYRSLSKNATWVRVVGLRRVRYTGDVYSLEVPESATVVTTAGLVAHNCFPKDTSALVRIGEDSGYDFGLLKGVISVNLEQYERVTRKIEKLAGGSVEGKTVAVWGLTFKARTDDLRDSPSLAIIAKLRERGARVQAYDPTVRRPLDGIDVRDDPYAACEGADVLAVLTEWDDFKWLDFDKVRELMNQPRVVDGRNLLDPAALKRRGFEYVGIGRV